MVGMAAFDMTNEQMKLSSYVHSHEVDEGVIGLYTPFNHEVTFLPTEVFEQVKENRLSGIPAQILDDLIRRRFVVSPETDASAINSYMEPPIKGFVSLWLLLVQTCNMGCSYCVVDAEEQTSKLPVLPVLSQVPKGRMTPEVALNGIDVFRKSLIKHKPPQAKVTIYGGEPLLNKALLFHVIPKIREISYEGQLAPINILCFTNGLLYDDEVTDLFVRYNVTVGLSLDGKKENHDSVRKKLDGSGTFDKTIESYHRYRQAGVAVGVSCTIGKHNVNDLSEIAQYFIEVLKVPSLQLQTPIQMPGEKNDQYVLMKDAAASAWAAFKRCREAGIEEGLAMRRISAFISGKFHKRDCFAVGGELVVTPDGTTGPCHNATIGGEQYFRGNVNDPNIDLEKQPNFVEWHNRMPLNMPGCHGCSFIGLCGGGCPYNALITKGSIWEKDPQQCGYMEQFVNLLLEEVWQRYSAAPKG
jgi:uncharacterized protein